MKTMLFVSLQQQKERKPKALMRAIISLIVKNKQIIAKNRYKTLKNGEKTAPISRR